MSCHINAVVLDDNNYFSQGIQLLLMRYITQKGWSVTFLPEKQRSQADLIIQADNYCHSMQFCYIRGGKAHCRVITIREVVRPNRRRPACLSEHGVISRRDNSQTVLHQIEKMLALRQTVTLTEPQNCPRCSLTLTFRERQVLLAIGTGMTPNRVARHLKLHVKTISAHKLAAMSKLGFQRNIELYRWMRQNDLIKIV